MALKQLEFQLSTRHFPIPSDNQTGLGNSWWFSSPRAHPPSPFSSPFVEAQHGLVAVVPELLKEASEAWLQKMRTPRLMEPTGIFHPVVGALKIAAFWVIHGEPYSMDSIWIPYGFHARLGDTVSIMTLRYIKIIKLCLFCECFSSCLRRSDSAYKKIHEVSQLVEFYPLPTRLTRLWLVHIGSN